MPWTNTPFTMAAEARALAADTKPCAIDKHVFRIYREGGPSGVPLFTVCDKCGRTPLEILDGIVGLMAPGHAKAPTFEEDGSVREGGDLAELSEGELVVPAHRRGAR